MAKELPYIDEQGQLHYEAYFGKGRAFLRSALPTSHPEHLYNYLKNHGIDWTLYFEEDGRRKGIHHECGPVEKLLGLDKKNIGPLADVFGKFPGKERVEYTRSDMERAFAAGGANAAKERVSGNKLTLPVLDFNQWLKKYEDEGRTVDRETLDKIQRQGRMYRKGQGEKIEIIDITTNSEIVEEMLKGVAPIKNINKHYFLHEILAEVVMLPTDKPSNLYTIEKGDKTTLYFEEYPNKNVNAGNQHLYFLSNEKPVKGDWIYLNIVAKSGVFQIEKIESDGVIYLKGTSFCFEGKDFPGKKIIATTDTSLTKTVSDFDFMSNQAGEMDIPALPQPKDSFLFLYIGAHNVGGRKVNEVAIEAELLCCQTGAPCGYPCNGDCEKNAVKSMIVDITNTINIAPIK